MRIRPLNHLAPLALITLLALLPACSGEDETVDGNAPLVVAFEASPTHLDARIGNDQHSGRIFDLVYIGLVRLEPDGSYSGDVAESWEINDDNSITFKLREGIRFHDGSELDADDVLYTYETIMDESFPSAKGAGYADVERIEKVDSHTVVFHLANPNPGIFDNLTLGIVPEGADHDALQTAPVGAGPYQVVDFSRDQHVHLKRFDDFYGEPAKISDVRIRVIPDATTRALELQSQGIDFVSNAIPYDRVRLFEENDSYEVIAEPGSQYQYIAFNLRNRYLSNLDVRRAIAHAINRDRLITDLLRGYGEVTETLFPAGHWAHHDDLPSWDYDPARARELLDQAGFRDPDGDGPATRFELLYKTSTDPEARRQAEMIQQMLRQVGIEVTIQSNEFGTFFEDVQQGKYDLFSLRRAGVNDPDFYTYMFASENFPPVGQNRGYYANSRVDELLEAGRATWDRDERTAIYKEIQEILADELPYISLYHRYNVVIMDENLTGFEMYPAGFLLSIPEMSWEE